MKLDAPFLFEKKVMNGNFNWFLSKFCLRECMRQVCPPLAVEEFYENMKSDESSTSKTWNDFSLLTDRSDRDPAVQLMDRLKSIIILRSSNVHWNWFYDRLAKYHLVKNSSVKSKDHTEFWLLNLITNWPRFWKKKRTLISWFGRMTRFFFYEKAFNIKTSLIFCKCLQARNVTSGTNYSIYLWCCTTVV